MGLRIFYRDDLGIRLKLYRCLFFRLGVFRAVRGDAVEAFRFTRKLMSFMVV